MNRYTVYNVATGMVQYVTEPLTPEQYEATAATELANGCALTDALCVILCRTDRQRYNAESGEFENTSTSEEQAAFENPE